MKILQLILTVLGSAVVGFLISFSAALAGIELPRIFNTAIVVIMIVALNNALKTEKSKSRTRSILLISLVPFLIAIVLLSISLVSPIKKLITGDEGSEYIIAGAVKGINEDAPRKLDEEILLEGATVLSDKAFQINWKLYTYSKDELDLAAAEEILYEEVKAIIDNNLKMKELWRNHSVSISYLIKDKNDFELFDFVFGPDDY